jgi:hypothetical protein
MQNRFFVLFVLVALTGCSPVPSGLAPSAAAPAAQSWMQSKAAPAKALLYIADGATDDVFVYDYKTSQLVGTLHGMKQPYGMCVDAQGSVWITDLSAGAVVKYPHGKIVQAKRFATDGRAVGCSVDPTSGNLAVANVTTSSGGGSIRVFSSSGHTDYANPQCYTLEQPGYDSQGNLYVEAYSPSNAVVVCELPHGGNALQPIAVDRELTGAGSAMWDGKYITLTEESYQGNSSTAIHQMVATTSGGLQTVGTTVLTDPCHNSIDIWQPFIVGSKNTPVNTQQGDAVVAFDTSCQARERSKMWAYPASGAPLPDSIFPVKAPDGNAVSLATSSK